MVLTGGRSGLAAAASSSGTTAWPFCSASSAGVSTGGRSETARWSLDSHT